VYPDRLAERGVKWSELACVELEVKFYLSNFMVNPIIKYFMEKLKKIFSWT
jgi:hypothetical protein